jgi:hypothetical protein
MDPEEIELLLSSLEAGPGAGWRLALPRRLGAFGQRVMLKISTDWEKIPSPPPDERELKLARKIIGELELIIQRAGAEYLAYCAPYDREPTVHARTPEISIDREKLAKEGPDRWNFCFGRDDWEDGVICVEFEGLAVIETWGGG